MLRLSVLLGVVGALSSQDGGEGQPSRNQGVIDFYGRIQPLLAIHCVKCHGPEKAKAGLRLDLRESVLGRRDGHDPVVLPGRSLQSELIRRVLSKDPEVRMPPKGEPLTPDEVDLLKAWIDQGALWPERDDYWAFQIPRRPAIPEVRTPDWPRNPVDRFILHRLEKAGLTPAPPADRVALLRRVTADLLGVPPTPEEADLFLEDPSPDVYERLVDRLLADPRFGERWARHWLDLVRYAESEGFENDKVRPHAWRYRDYVITSFNEDKPYDRFVREQIAGDELYPEDPDAWVATGFARLSPWDDACKNEKQRWQDYLNDATDTAGSVFLGMTVGCARCHDHKYDRITQADYYGLQAFFAGTRREKKDLPGGGRDPERLRLRRVEAEAALKRLLRERQDLREEHLALEVLDRAGRGEPDEKLVPTEEELRKRIEARDKSRSDRLAREIRQNQEAAAFYRPTAEAVFAAGKEAPKIRILWRGDLNSPGPEAPPSFLRAMAPEKPAGARRSDLADWLASEENPLTARVIVNRLWQHHFGRGIVETPSDFGRNGRAPSHPELLDWLACELVARGWRLKPLHRLMVTSAAYRQSGAWNPAAAGGDPDNRLLWRMSRRRLEGEAIRDAILAAAGRLNPERGGPGVYAKIGKEVLIDIPNNDKLLSWGQASEREGLRRTVYVFQRRSLMYPIVQAFDGADMAHSCAQRAVTTVAPQALTLLNGEFCREEARHFALRVAREAGPGRPGQVERAYRVALLRRPAAAEREAAVTFLGEQSRRRGAGGGDADFLALVDFCHVLLNTNEFLTVE